MAHKSMSVLNDEQMDTFLSAVEQDPIWHDFFYTELTTGLRLGEICGLMWSDFDERKGTLHISRTLHKEKSGRLSQDLRWHPNHRAAVQHSGAAAATQKDILLPLDLLQSTPSGSTHESCRRIPPAEKGPDGKRPA